LTWILEWIGYRSDSADLEESANPAAAADFAWRHREATLGTGAAGGSLREQAGGEQERREDGKFRFSWTFHVLPARI